MELRRRIFAEFARKLEDEIAAHGVADQRDRLQMVQIDEEAHDGVNVAGEAGVIERGGKRLGPAAVAHVHADDVAAGLPELVGVADDVLRVGGAFESMHDDGGRARGANVFGLPVAVAEDLAGDLVLGGRRDFDELRLGGGQAVGARQIVAEDGLQMAVAQKTPRMEVGGLNGDGFECRWRHQCLSSMARGAVEEGFGVERAGGFVLVLEVDVHIALLCECGEAFGEGVELDRRVAAAAAQAEAGEVGCRMDLRGKQGRRFRRCRVRLCAGAGWHRFLR